MAQKLYPTPPDTSPLSPNSPWDWPSTPTSIQVPHTTTMTGTAPGAWHGPGYDLPNFKDLINDDPGLGLARGDLEAQGVANATTRRGAARRAFTQFGDTSVLNNLGDDYKWLAQDIDPTTITAANDLTNSGLSTMAQLAHAHAVNQQNIIDRLAARNMLRSGGLGADVGQEGQTYKQNQFDSRQKFLDYLAGVQSAFAQAEAQRSRDLGTAYNDAAGRQYQQHPVYQDPDQPTSSTSTSNVTANQTSNRGLYQLGDNYYDQAGNPLTLGQQILQGPGEDVPAWNLGYIPPGTNFGGF